MTEEEWTSCVEPEKMLAFVRPSATNRKLNLFAAASWEFLASLFSDTRHLEAIAFLERRAEGLATPTESRQVSQSTRLALPEDLRGDEDTPDRYLLALYLYREVVSWRPAVHSVLATGRRYERLAQRDYQVRLFRDLFGTPCQPVTIDPRWKSGDVVGLARAIYDDRAFDRLPILADALIDAGCDGEQILEHCRGPGPHVRGCWVVDLVLGKE